MSYASDLLALTIAAVVAVSAFPLAYAVYAFIASVGFRSNPLAGMDSWGAVKRIVYGAALVSAACLSPIAAFYMLMGHVPLQHPELRGPLLATMATGCTLTMLYLSRRMLKAGDSNAATTGDTSLPNGFGYSEAARAVAVVLLAVPAYFAFAAVVTVWQPIAATPLFTSGPHTLSDIALYALDLSCRGMFFDVMEHFELSFTHLKPNKQNWTFMAFSFCYRLYCSIAVLAALVNVVLYWRSHTSPVEIAKPGRDSSASSGRGG